MLFVTHHSQLCRHLNGSKRMHVGIGVSCTFWFPCATCAEILLSIINCTLNNFAQVKWGTIKSKQRRLSIAKWCVRWRRLVQLFESHTSVGTVILIILFEPLFMCIENCNIAAKHVVANHTDKSIKCVGIIEYMEGTYSVPYSHKFRHRNCMSCCPLPSLP